jgi:hypothetical protein
VKKIVGIFTDKGVEAAIDNLQAIGVSKDSIKVLDKGYLQNEVPLSGATAPLFGNIATGDMRVGAIVPNKGTVPESGGELTTSYLTDALSDLGLTDESTRFYAHAIQNDSVVVIVNCKSENGDGALNAMRNANPSHLTEL